jgi:hypothetical protein
MPGGWVGTQQHWHCSEKVKDLDNNSRCTCKITYGVLMVNWARVPATKRAREATENFIVNLSLGWMRMTTGEGSWTAWKKFHGFFIYLPDSVYLLIISLPNTPPQLHLMNRITLYNSNYHKGKYSFKFLSTCPHESIILIFVVSFSLLLSVLNFRSTLDARRVVVRNAVDSVKIHQMFLSHTLEFWSWHCTPLILTSWSSIISSIFSHDVHACY